MKVITAACHEEIEPHFHLQDSGWTEVQGKKIKIIRVDYHDPKDGNACQTVSIPVEAP